jgi:hypothetical protein
MTTENVEGKGRKVIGAEEAVADEPTEQAKRDEVEAEKAESKVKEDTAELKEQNARRRVRHNRG